MELSTWALFIPACFALNLAPGPNNLLSVHNATHHGFFRACLAGLGRLLAFAIMIGLAAAGLAAVLQASTTLFMAVKIAGAAYLLYLALQLWRSHAPVLASEPAASPGNLWRLMRQECLVAAGNPKAILIFTAFLPQFVATGQPFAAQFLQLGLAFLLLEWVAIGLYACLGLHLRRWLATPRAQALFNRGCGALLALAAGALLAGRKV
ncbi:LysE family translocator [Pseudomonas sp. RIT-PI-S]|uniref:LysE family translocator n=1 Tax=Pseudomonas sp. RIT-PI-S TaxID=3035295 RepID=UPI0021DAE653|nr:LysE family translocator [Pseudomonas sp. RIT-PI-S]